jgi:hypothetical protein
VGIHLDISVTGRNWDVLLVLVAQREQIDVPCMSVM